MKRQEFITQKEQAVKNAEYVAFMVKVTSVILLSMIIAVFA